MNPKKKEVVMYGYDHYILGAGNPLYPGLQPDLPDQLTECDACRELFHEDELIIDRWQGKDTGWRWCTACKAMQDEESH